MSLHEYHDLQTVRDALSGGRSFSNSVLQGLDLTSVEDMFRGTDVDGAAFLGCQMSAETTFSLIARGALVFPRLEGLHFNPYRPALYTAGELFDGFDPGDPCTYCNTPDAKIYRHWSETGRESPPSVMESLARRLHDHAITDALDDIIKARSPEKVIGIMGGHSMARNEPSYREVALIARTLARSGYLVVTGGGPGAMEAGHLGVWFADRPVSELDAAIEILSSAPLYKDLQWLSAAFRVMERFPQSADALESLGIPTWHYGHEPPTPFASRIAKYFANSVREEGLITIAIGGIIFSPGSAGTIQELFQDAAQNHYVTTGWVSPMILLDTEYWTTDKPIYSVFRELAENEEYGSLVTLVDGHDAVVEFLENNPPRQVSTSGFVFCDVHCANT